MNGMLVFIVAGVAVGGFLLWRKVLVPVSRVLELSEDLNSYTDIAVDTASGFAVQPPIDPELARLSQALANAGRGQVPEPAAPPADKPATTR
jgi:hypothetical protein